MFLKISQKLRVQENNNFVSLLSLKVIFFHASNQNMKNL